MRRQNQLPHHTSGGAKKPMARHIVEPESSTTVNDLQAGHIVPNTGMINNLKNDGNQADKQIQGVSSSYITMEEKVIQINGNQVVQINGNKQTGDNHQFEGVMEADSGGKFTMGYVYGGGRIEQPEKESAEEVQEEQEDVLVQGEQQRRMDRFDHLAAQVQHLTDRFEIVSGQIASFAPLADILAQLDLSELLTAKAEAELAKKAHEKTAKAEAELAKAHSELLVAKAEAELAKKAHDRAAKAEAELAKAHKRAAKAKAELAKASKRAAKAEAALAEIRERGLFPNFQISSSYPVEAFDDTEEDEDEDEDGYVEWSYRVG